jgi:protocatechuate 3,4-dioxygenase beta subunit
MCTASRTDGAGQGPFFIHNEEKTDDIDLFRQDIRGQYDPEAEEGIEMQLHLRILDATSTSCNGTPVADVEVYIWHTDGQGYYSGFGNPGDQKPDEPYAGVPGQNDLDNPDRFCRGAQVTNSDGVVSFRSYFPGWYNGRDVHIHFVALNKGTMSKGRVTYSGDGHLFTTQFYFEPEFTDMVHKSAEPYKRRTEGSLTTYYDGAIKADEGNNSGLRAKATLEGGIVVAQMQILLDPAGTAAGGGGGMFGF